jgi:hypothetical protein
VTTDDDDLAKVLVDTHASMTRRAWVIYYAAVVSFVAVVIAACLMALSLPVLVLAGAYSTAAVVLGIVALTIPAMVGLAVVTERTRQKWAALEEW